jgi:hypothetical protein
VGGAWSKYEGKRGERDEVQFRRPLGVCGRACESSGRARWVVVCCCCYCCVRRARLKETFVVECKSAGAVVAGSTQKVDRVQVVGCSV